MNHFQFRRATTICAALALIASSSHAQQRPEPKPVADAPKATELGEQIVQIRVRNVPADFIAYWLAPGNQPKPFQLQMSERNAGAKSNFGNEMSRQPGNGKGPFDLKLPPDVEILAALEPQNLLLAKGTEAGLTALKKLVSEIDVPIQQIEITAEIFEISPEDLQEWPLVFHDAAMPDEAEKTSLPGDITLGAAGAIPNSKGGYFSQVALAEPISDRALITYLLNEGLANSRIRLLTAPRVTAIDGLTATLVSTEQRALQLDATQTPATEATDEMPAEEDAEGNDSPVITHFDTVKPNEKWQADLSFIENQTGLTVTPTLHGDLIHLDFQVIINNVTTAGNTILRDGQTLPVRLANVNPRTGWVRVALIKTAIIRRAGENANIAAPGN